MPPSEARLGPPPSQTKKAKGKTKWARFTIPAKKGTKHAAPGGHSYVSGAQAGFSGWVRVGSPRFRALAKRAHPTAMMSAHYRPYSKSWTYAQNKKAGSAPRTGEDVSHSSGSTTARHTKVQSPKKGGGGGGGGGGKGGGGGSAGARGVGKAIGSSKTASVTKRPGRAADAMAGLQYDAQINDTKAQQAQQQRQSAQDLADIGNWYTQLQSLNSQGNAAYGAAATQAAGASDASTQAILHAIGGGANQNAGAVGAAGDDQSAILRMLGVIQNGAAGQTATALGSSQAGQMLAQKALNSQAQQALQQTLTDLMTQRGQAKVAAKQTIMQNNNAARQQNFGNRISKLDAIIGAQAAVGNQQLQQLQIGQARKAAHQGAGGGGQKSSFVPWAKLSSGDQYQLIQMFRQGPSDASGNPTALPYAKAAQRAKTMGYTNPQAFALLRSFY